MSTIKASPYYTYIEPVVKNPIVKSVAPYIFSLITLIIFLIFAIRPTLNTISELQKEIDNNQKVLDSLNQKSKNLSTGKTNYENMGSEIKKKIAESLPLNPNVVTLTANIQNSVPLGANVAALQIEPVVLFDLQNTTPTLDLQELSFSFNLDGNYPQLLNALDNLNKTSRLLNVTSIVLSKPSSGSGTLAITGKAYFLK